MKILQRAWKPKATTEREGREGGKGEMEIGANRSAWEEREGSMVVVEEGKIHRNQKTYMLERPCPTVDPTATPAAVEAI